MEFEFADLKPSVMNAFLVLAIVIVMVPLAKAFVNRFPIPGISDLVNAV